MEGPVEAARREMKENGEKLIGVKVLVCERTAQVLVVSPGVGLRDEQVQVLV